MTVWFWVGFLSVIGPFCLISLGCAVYERLRNKRLRAELEDVYATLAPLAQMQQAQQKHIQAHMQAQAQTNSQNFQWTFHNQPGWLSGGFSSGVTPFTVCRRCGDPTDYAAMYCKACVEHPPTWT